MGDDVGKKKKTVRAYMRQENENLSFSPRVKLLASVWILEEPPVQALISGRLCLKRQARNSSNGRPAFPPPLLYEGP